MFSELHSLNMRVLRSLPDKYDEDVVYHSAGTVFVWKRLIQPPNLGAIVSFDATLRIELDEEMFPCEIEILVGMNKIFRTYSPEIKTNDYVGVKAELPVECGETVNRVAVSQIVDLKRDQKRSRLIAIVDRSNITHWCRIAKRLWIGLSNNSLSSVCLDIHEGVSDRDWYGEVIDGESL